VVSGIASIALQQEEGSVSSPPHETWSCFAAAWRRIESWTSRPSDSAGAGDPASTQAAVEAEPVALADARAAAAKADLLACRMVALHLDTVELTAAELATLRDMQRLCAACESRRQCADDLGDEFADPGWQNWRNYCPNATTLSILTALRGCGSRGGPVTPPET
jgi:hypothetical protein